MVTMESFAQAFGFDAKSNDTWVTLGKVQSVSGNTLSVKLGGSTSTTACEAYCLADVGDIVLVVITNGSARAVAVKGGGSASAILAAANIGKSYEASKDSINTTADQDAYVQGAKITLPAGKYVIYTQWTFGSTSSAAGSTTVGIGNSSGIWNDSRDRIRQADAWFTAHSTTYICTLNAQYDVYSYGSSSIARSGCGSFIRAIKIG